MIDLKNGEITVGLEQEEIIWKDKRRVTVFALPLTFTTYRLTPSRLFIEKGFLKRTEDEVRLYRIKDITYSQSFSERIGNTGTVTLISTDATDPEIKLQHIKNAKNIKNVVSQLVEKSRHENGVRTSEVIGGGGPVPAGSALHGDGPAMGPGMFPDADHDGVDDRLQ